MMQCFAASNDNKQRRREERLLYEAFQHGRVVSIRKDLTEEPPLPPTPSLLSTSSLSSSATTTKPKQAAFRKVLQALQEQHHQHQQLQLGRRRRRRHQEDFCLLRPQDGRLESSSKKYNQRGKYKVLKDRATGNPLSISGSQENIQGPNGTSNGTVTASATATGGDGELLIRKTIRSVRHTRSCTNCKFRDWSKGDVVYLLLSNKSSHENDENEIDDDDYDEEEEEREEDYSYLGYGNGETQDEMENNKAPTKVVLHWLCPDCALKFGMPRSYYHQNRNVLCPVASRNRPVPRELPWWSWGGEMFLQNCSVYDWLPDCFATYGETNSSSSNNQV